MVGDRCSIDGGTYSFESDRFESVDVDDDLELSAVGDGPDLEMDSFDF